MLLCDAANRQVHAPFLKEFIPVWGKTGRSPTVTQFSRPTGESLQGLSSTVGFTHGCTKGDQRVEEGGGKWASCRPRLVPSFIGGSAPICLQTASGF